MKYVGLLFCIFFINWNTEMLFAQVGKSVSDAKTNKKTIHFPSCDDPQNPGKKKSYSSTKISESSISTDLVTLENTALQTLETTKYSVSFDIGYEGFTNPKADDERIKAIKKLLLDIAYEVEIHKGFATLSLIKEPIGNNIWRINIASEKITKWKIPSNIIDRDKYNKRMAVYFFYKIEEFVGSGIYPKQGITLFYGGIYKMTIGDGGFSGRDEYGDFNYESTGVNITPLGYFGHGGRKFNPVYEDGTSVFKGGIELSDYNKYQKVSFESVPIEGGLSLGKGIVKFGVNSGLFKLTGYDAESVPQKNIDISFTSITLGFGSSFGEEWLKSKGVDIPEGKSSILRDLKGEGSLLENLSKYCSGLGISVAIPNGADIDIHNLNYPMDLQDFYGWGYIASISLPAISFNYINFWFTENALNRNYKFEAFSSGTGIKADPCTVFSISNIDIGIDIKVGFFQPIDN